VLNPDDDFVYVSWTAGNTVYIDQMLAADGFFVRRISYIPYPVSPYNALAGVTVTDMKISKTMRIFLCGSILASNGGQDFSASYLIRATFNGRGAAHVEHSIPVEGDPTQSFRGTAISLDVAEEQVYFIEDQWMSYANHQQETAILVSFDMPGGFRLQDDDQDAISQATTTTITPNPSSDRIQVRSDQSFNRAEVFDVAGRMVYSLPLLSTEDTILELKDLTKGIYTLRLSHDNGTTTVQQIVRN
jgi:hypothetical protein